MYDTRHYDGPGSPIVLMTPGEQNGTGLVFELLFTRRYTYGILAAEIGAAVIVLEHRKSSINCK